MTTLVWAQLTIPSAPVINSVAEPRRISSAGERQAIPLVYGEYRLGGLILNILKHGSDPTKVVVQILWCHKCDDILDVRLNDQALSAGTSATHYTGAQTTVDPTLLAAFAAQSITYTDTLTGYAYSVFSLPVVEFSGQLSFSARIKGRRLYDPRKDSTAGGTGSHRLNDPATWEWSDNPSLALADFLSNTTYGAGELVKWSSVITAANANDASIGSPAEKHRILGVAFTQQGSVYAIGEALRAYAGCWIVPDQAGIALLVDADAAAVASYAHSSGQIAALDRLDKRDLSTAPTVVEVVYTDTSKIPWRDAVAVAKVTGAGTTLPWRLSSVKLPGIHRYSQAYREAVERLNKLRLNDLSCTLEVFDIGIRHQIGDIVSVTHPIGPSAKPFRVVDIDSPKQGSWRLSLIEHDPAAYSTTVQTAPTYSDTSLVAPAGPPSDVTGLSATVAQGLITWTWNSPTDRNYLETQVRLGGTDWDSASPVWSGRGTQWLQRVTTTGTRTLRVKHVNQDGVLSTNAASASITVNSGDLVQSEPGTPGQSTVVVNLYQWATSQPSNPSGSSVWWWTTATHNTYNGGNGWTTTIPANPGTAGAGLWVAAKPVTAAVGTTSSTVLWDSGYTVYKAAINGSTGPTGATGPAGAKTATATVYKWALTIPTVSGTGTYTWATGDVGTVPNGWTVQPGTGAAGQTLWAASVLLIDATGAAASSINWSTASVTARGYIGVDGATGPTGPAGADGISARRAYVLTTLSSLGTGTVVTTGINSLPPNGSFGVNGWTASPGVPAVGETLYQSDGLYNPATNQITWETPYVSSLKVGSLSAISVNTGALTVQDNVTVSSTGAVRGGATGYSLGTGFWQGYDVSAYKWRVGNPTGARIQWNGSAVEVYNSSNQLVMTSGGVDWSQVLNRPSNLATLDPIAAAMVNSVPDYGGNRTFRTAHRPYVPRGQNMLLYSEQFNQSSYWSVSGALAFGAGSVADTVLTTDPLGGYTAEFVAENSNTSTHGLSLQAAARPSFVAGRAYTLSLYAKYAGRHLNLSLGSAAFSPISPTVVVDLTTGGVITYSNNTAVILGVSVTPVGNGWYRCSVTARATATAQDQVYIQCHNGTSNSYAGVTSPATGIYIWGAQLEEGVRPSPYIATTTGTVDLRQSLRAGDVWIDQGAVQQIWQNEALNSSSWNKVRVTVDGTAVTAPDGSLSAYKILETAQTEQSYYIDQRRDVTTGIGQPITLAIYAKAGDRDKFILQAFGDPTTSVHISTYFNLATGVITYRAFASAATRIADGIESVGNGWYLCWMTFWMPVSDNKIYARATFQDPSGSYDSTYTSVGGLGLYLWGMQLTNTDGPARYVKNPGTAAKSTVGNNSIYVYDGSVWNLSAYEPRIVRTTVEPVDKRVNDIWQNISTTTTVAGVPPLGTARWNGSSWDLIAFAGVNLSNVSTYIEAAAIGSLQIPVTGYVGSGKTSYGAGTGWILDHNAGTPRLDIGDSTNYLRWNGADLVATALTVRKSDGTVLFSAKGASVPPWVTYVQPAAGAGGYSLVSGIDQPTNTVNLKTLKAGDGVDIADSDTELVFSAPLAQTAIPSATGPATTSFAQVPGVTLQLDANSIYRFQAGLQVSGSGNMELRFAFPSGSTVFGYALSSISNPPVIDFTVASSVVGTAAGKPILIDAVVVTGSSGGMFTPEFRRLVSGAAVSLVRGSWFSAEKIIREFSTGGSLMPPISGMGGNSAITSVSGAAATSTSKLITRTSSQFTFTRSGRSNENYTWLGAGPASAFDVLYELVSATVEIAGQGSHTTSGFGVWQQMTVERTATMQVTANYTGAVNVRQVRFTFNIKFRDRATGTITTWFAGNSGLNTQSVVVRAESGSPAGDPGGAF